MKVTSQELIVEVNILEEAELVTTDEDEIGGRQVHYLIIKDKMLNELFQWMDAEKYSIRTLLNTIDFTVVDE